MNIILGNSVRLPLRPQLQLTPAAPLPFPQSVTAANETFLHASANEPAVLPPAGSLQRKSDTQLFLQQVLGLNVQLSPPTPSALAD